MGVVWGVAGVSIIVFVFLAIWFIDPALLTLVLQFRQARCVTKDAAFLVGISNCSWTSCRLGCTREIYKCWQVQVSFEFVRGTEPYRPPWATLSNTLDEEEGGFGRGSDIVSDANGLSLARLYPNVRGCGYPPDLNCERFYHDFGDLGRGEFDCWVSTTDSSIAMTELDLERAKREVVGSLVPLFIFIVFVLYAFCRLGVFSVCNPLRLCPKANDTRLDMPSLTPRRLFEYKKSLIARKNQALQNLHGGGGGGAPPGAAQSSSSFPVGTALPATPGSKSGIEIPATIEEDEESSGVVVAVATSAAAAGPSPSEEDSSTMNQRVKKPRQRRRRRSDAEGSVSSRDSEGRPANGETPPLRMDSGAASSTSASASGGRVVFSASSLVSLHAEAGGGGGRGSVLEVPGQQQQQSGGFDSRRDSFERELMDLDLLDGGGGGGGGGGIHSDAASVRSVVRSRGGGISGVGGSRPVSRGAWMDHLVQQQQVSAAAVDGGKKDS